MTECVRGVGTVGVARKLVLFVTRSRWGATTRGLAPDSVTSQ